MKYRAFASLLAVSLMALPQGVWAAPQVPAPVTQAASAPAAMELRVVGAPVNSPDVAHILEIHEDLVKASNQHQLEQVLKNYDPSFMSGDNLTLVQLKSMIEDTWAAYPDIVYTSTPVEVRVNGDWATVETMDNTVGTAKADKEISASNGKLTSQSRSMLYLRRMGPTWEIVSDATLWEQACIRYGVPDTLNVTLSAPEQVKAGEKYSASIQANLPNGAFTIISINNQPITMPHVKVEDKFRTLSGGEDTELQRMLKANAENRNEVVTATIGVTEITQSGGDRPSIALNGIVTVVKRVNVVPISLQDMKAAEKEQETVGTLASGKTLPSPKDSLSTDGGYDLELSPDAQEPESPADK